MSATILVVEDEKHTREGLLHALSDHYELSLARDIEEALQLLNNKLFDVVLTDLRIAGQSGMKVIDYCLARSDPPICIMMTAYGNVETAVDAMKRGAFDFLTKPVNLEKLELIIRRALKSRLLERENHQLHERLDQRYNFQGIIGHSGVLKQVLDRAQQAAASQATILLTGETGTGKELIAQMIHQNSNRARGPLVPVHCAAIPENLLESELFGHEKGAFTGAMEQRIGRFEAADKGTLFLDEIGEINGPAQVKLLRFLESKVLERVGSQKPITVDVRLICATHRDLAAMIQAGDFREDLYYRLNVVPIHLPPLRERTEDIPLLLEHHTRKFAKDNGKAPISLSQEALQVLQAYPWPGNIRELRNFCENIAVMQAGSKITRADLDPKFLGKQENMEASTLLSSPISPPLPSSKLENEKQLIGQALVQTKGNRTRAAAILGISRRTLLRKLRQWPELEMRGRE